MLAEGDKANSLSSLPAIARSNELEMCWSRLVWSYQFFQDTDCSSGRDSTRPPTVQSGTPQWELTTHHLVLASVAALVSFLVHSGFQTVSAAFSCLFYCSLLGYRTNCKDITRTATCSLVYATLLSITYIPARRPTNRWKARRTLIASLTLAHVGLHARASIVTTSPTKRRFTVNATITLWTPTKFEIWL